MNYGSGHRLVAACHQGIADPPYRVGKPVGIGLAPSLRQRGLEAEPASQCAVDQESEVDEASNVDS